jgi:uncharacterized repeat protein (TIGR03803 family)
LGTQTGITPKGSLTLRDGKFYGMTSRGGANDLGVIFEWDPITNIYSKKIDFNGIENGSGPEGSLTLYGNKFYGMTSFGGTSDVGVLFEWDPVTNGFIKKFEFDFTNGGIPYGCLTLCGSKFYGMTSIGGLIGSGNIFEWDPFSNSYTHKFGFEFGKGDPRGSLTLSEGEFYGMTNDGGINFNGAAFKWDPVSNMYTEIFAFDNLNGSKPATASFLECPMTNTYKTLILNSIFPEGLYIGNGYLCKAQDQNGDHYPGTIADQITVELHDAVDYTNIVHTTNNLNFSTTGLSILSVPSNLNESYYITIKYRNGTEITTASPVSFAGGIATYNFDNALKVFGQNLHQMSDGNWVIYSGDINQDGFVNATDLNLVNNACNDFTTGYLPTDVNGDGIIDANDLIIVDNNASKFVLKVTP